MGHPDIDNPTAFALELLFVEDEKCRPVVSPIVKATYDIDHEGRLSPADEQVPVCFAGEYFGEAGTSSVRYEPEVAFTKPSTDVVLLGYAYAQQPNAAHSVVTLKLGAIHKRVRASGSRVWEVDALGPRVSPATPFERVALVWENAFGGSRPSPDDPERCFSERRNPLGKGFLPRGEPLVDGMPLPHLEYPDDLLLDPQGRVRPAGFGFTYPHWEPRIGLAGTYDEAWQRDRAPLLPRDFQRAHFQAAPPDQITPTPLSGHEQVEVHGTLASRKPLRFALPGLEAPRFTLATRQGDSEHTTRLDTVIIDSEAMQLMLLWRQPVVLPSSPHDVLGLQLRCDGAPRRPVPTPPETNVVSLRPRT